MHLSQTDTRRHRTALSLLDSAEPLTMDQKRDFITLYHEGATHMSAQHSAFFTPYELALHFAMEVPAGGRILDLCAGIGTLSLAIADYHTQNGATFDFTLVELNEDYCRMAKRLMPEATVICGSIFDPAVRAQLDNQTFDVAISNPPYGGKNIANGQAPRYRGSDCEYAVIDIASDYANEGVFLIPQSSVPFRISGSAQNHLDVANRKYDKFRTETGIILSPGMGIDTSFAEKLWRATAIRTEIATTNFRDTRAKRRATSEQFELLAA